MTLSLYVQCCWQKQRALAAAMKERTRQGWVIPSSAYISVHVCARVCVCVSAGQSEGSVVVSGNTPTPALIQRAPAMKAGQVCNLASRVHPRPQRSEQQPLQKSVFNLLLPSQLRLQHRPIFCGSSFPSVGRKLQHRTHCLSLGSQLFVFSVLWRKSEHRLFSPVRAYFT